jgi:dTDP-4-amino-4,6-dideoxygalactose transaminase
MSMRTVSTRIRLYDTTMNYRRYQDEMDAALRDVLEQGDFEMGDAVRQFEREFAAYCGVQFGIATTSGTMALHLALRALGLGPGDEVITAANTDVGTVLGIEHTGATVRLADIEEATFNIDPKAVEACITRLTRAIVPVHMYGLPADMDSLRAVVRRHDLALVEDAALAAGASYKGRKAGNLGDAAIFSTAAGKVLGGLGSGGIIVTHREEAARLANSLRHYGRDDTPYRTERAPGTQPGVTVRFGYNARLDTLQAAALRVRLRHLDEELARRRAIARVYGERLGRGAATLPEVPAESEHAYRTYVIRLPNRDRVHRRLLELGIETGMHYTPPIHLHPYWKHQGYREGQFPVAERVSGDLLCLPCHPALTEEQAHEIAGHILTAL